MTGTLRNKPAKCCCDCPCSLSLSFNSWIETAGNWTIVAPLNFEATTSDSDAELTCNVTHSGWKIATCRIVQRALGEWVRFGFRDASGDDRVYVRWKVTKPAASYIHDVEIIEIDDGGSPATLATINWTGSGLTAELTREFHIWHDPDNSLFELFYSRTSSALTGPVRVSTQTELDRPYVATEAISNTVDFEKATIGSSETVKLFRRCIWKDTGPTYHTDEGPGEFQIEISGVTAGSGVNGGSFAVFNDTFVLPFLSGAVVDTGGLWRLVVADATYGNIIYLVSATYLYATTNLRIDLKITIGTQVVTFVCTFAGDCSYDWRSHGGGDAYFYQTDCDQLPFTSQTSDDNADFSAAVVNVTPIP